MYKYRYILSAFIALWATSSFAYGPESLSIIGNIKSLSGAEWTDNTSYCPLEKGPDGKFTGIMPAIAENKPSWSDNILFLFKSGTTDFSVAWGTEVTLPGNFVIKAGSNTRIDITPENFGYYKVEVEFTSDTEANVTFSKTSGGEGGSGSDDTGGFRSISVTSEDGNKESLFAISNHLKIRPRNGVIYLYDTNLSTPEQPLRMTSVTDFSNIAFSSEEGESIAEKGAVTTGVANVTAEADTEISVRGRYICISGASDGQHVSVYNLTGTMVLSAAVDGGHAEICADALPSGIYIVTVNSTVRKIALK